MARKEGRRARRRRNVIAGAREEDPPHVGVLLRSPSRHVGDEDTAVGWLDASNEAQWEGGVDAADGDAKAACSCKGTLRIQSRRVVMESHRHVWANASRMVRGCVDVTTTHLLQNVTHRIAECGAIRSPIVECVALEIDPEVRATDRKVLGPGGQSTSRQGRL